MNRESDREQNENELDWDSEIRPDQGRSEFVVLPDGTECAFEVKKFLKDRSSRGFAMARLDVICTADDGRRTYVHENLTFTDAAMFRIRDFGEAIGHLIPGQTGRIDWDNGVLGATGRCRLGVETWTRRDGEEAESNKVKEWLPAPKADDLGGEEASFG